MDYLTILPLVGAAATVVPLLQIIWRLIFKRHAERALVENLRFSEELSRLHLEYQQRHLELAEYRRRVLEQLLTASKDLDEAKRRLLLDAINQSSSVGRVRYAEKIVGEVAKASGTATSAA